MVTMSEQTKPSMFMDREGDLWLTYDGEVMWFTTDDTDAIRWCPDGRRREDIERATGPLRPVAWPGEQQADGYQQWAVQYGDGEPSICEGTEGHETAEEEARTIAAGNAMVRADHPNYPTARVVKRWITTGPWTLA